MIAGTVKTCKKFNVSWADTAENIKKEFSLSGEAAVAYLKKYW